MIKKSNLILGVEHEILDTDCEEALDVLINSINTEGNLTFFGELAAQYQIREHLKNRSLIQKTHKTLDLQTVSKPIIVIGLPRSGTTFLFNLLSKDESSRSPLFWEMMKPLPLVKKKSISELSRIFQSDAILFFKERFIPKLDDLHNIRSKSPEECLLIKVFALQSILYFYMANTPTYLDYLSQSDSRLSYKWHHKFLRVLEEKHKPERWLLKDPSHLGNLEEILSFYPDACFIHICRDPAETLPSICSLTSQVRKGFSNSVDLKDLGNRTLEFWSRSNAKNEAQKQKIPAESYMQIEYTDLVNDPINLIKDIYSKFSLALNDKTVRAMETYVEEGSKEAKAKHNYSLEDYGLDLQEVHNKLNFS